MTELFGQRGLRPLLHALFCLILVFFCSACTRREQIGLLPGDRAPDFQLQNTAGELVSLKSLQNSGVVLNFWATWCAPCIEEMPALIALHRELLSKGAQVVAIAVDDDIETVRNFKRQYDIPFELLLDNDGKVRDAYRVEGYPETFLLKKGGYIAPFFDPAEQDLKNKIVGPRPWNLPPFATQVLKSFGNGEPVSQP